MTVLLTIVGIVVFAVGLLLSIALHEVGHLVPAKRFGVRVTQYMVGFGRTVWSVRRGETEYGIKALPFGGYIRMIGMFPPGRGEDEHHLRRSSTGPFQSLVESAHASARQELRPGDEHRVFYRKHWWQKVIIMLGGPTMNLVIATVLLAVVLCGIGIPVYAATTSVSSLSQCVVPADRQQATCQPGDPTAPAAAAGVQPGDRIVAVAGEATPDWKAAQAAIRDHPGQRVDLVVERAGRRVVLPLTLATTQRASSEDPTPREVGFLGVVPQQVVDHRETAPLSAVPSAVGGSLVQVAGLVVNLPARMVGVWQAATGGERDADGPIGIVGAGRIGGEIAAQPDPLYAKAGGLLAMLASVNLALFVFNLVPLLPLDGGHVAGALWEALRRAIARLRRRADPGFVDVAKALPVAYAVAVLLIGMSALLLYADIVNPVRLPG